MPKPRKGKLCSSSSLVAAPETVAPVTQTRSDGLFSPVVTRGKRRSSLRPEEETDKLAKKFKTGLKLDDSEPRKLRKLQNITNLVDQEASLTLETKKRKLVQEDGGQQNCRRKKTKSSEQKDDGTGGEAAVIAIGHEKLREALGKHYFDAKNRLNLDYLPNCLLDVKQCAELHAKRINQAKRVNSGHQRDTKALLIDNRPIKFLENLEQSLLRNEFIDVQLFVQTLELMLTINRPSTELFADYNVQFVLDQAVHVLDRTVEQFPPCWLDLKAAYHNIIFGTLEEDCFCRYDRSEGLFKVVLFLLESAVGDSVTVNVSRTRSNERSMDNFHLWEQTYVQKYDFDVLTRNEKLERLFLVMTILVKILELDLSMWILRHPHKIEENLGSNTRKPLVVSLMWHEHSTIGAVNSLIGRIIRLYVDVVALEYPAEDVCVLSRLLSVIGTAINLSEIQYDGTVDYPCIKDNTRYFVRQISRAIEESARYSVALRLRSIQQMRSPLIRMVLVDEFLQKLNHGSDAPSAASYMKHLVKGLWKSFPQGSPVSDSSKSDARYLLLDAVKKQRRKLSHEVLRSEYVSLLLQGFRAYMEVYPLQKYFCSLKHSEDTANASRSPSRSPKNRLDLATLERRIGKMEKQRKSSLQVVRPKRDRPAALTADGAPLVLEEVNVTPALQLYYRDEMKHLLLIQRWLQMKTLGEQELQELFAPWRRYMASVDVTLSCE